MGLVFVTVGIKKRQPSSRSAGYKCQTLNTESSSEAPFVFCKSGRLFEMFELLLAIRLCRQNQFWFNPAEYSLESVVK
jgi:hypothetical protein